MKSKFFAWSILLYCASVRGQLPSAPTEPPEPLRGSLVIGGGGALPESVAQAFVKLAGGDSGRIVLIPTASETADKDDPKTVLAAWAKRTKATLHVLHTRDRAKANEPEFARPLHEATGVWLGGGDQTKLAVAYRGTLIDKELHELLKRGGVIGGTSAGAAVMSQLMIASGPIVPKLGAGFGFLPGVVVDQHFLKRNRVNRLIDVLSKHPGWAGLGIDEKSAVVVQGRSLTVVGESYALICQAAGHDRPASCQVLQPGERADLVAVCRNALARTQPQFPAAKPPAPNVKQGTLVIGGGGALPDDVYHRFLAAAGGPGTRIAFIPTALDKPTGPDPGEFKRLQKLGAKNVFIFHATSRAEADDPAFVAQLKDAGGIWFTGGRQWRFVDAYQGTKTEAAMHAVLARGGAIGGTSAGASIQADYMVRGDPLGNTVMMAEGYERGLGFIQGVAIDQHFTQRKRQPDMELVMSRFPQLLGIGLDEGTAIVVRGSIAEVVGKSKVAVYDTSRPRTTGVIEHEVLTPGNRYGHGSKPGNNHVCVWSVGALWPSRPISSSQRVINPMVAERNHDYTD